MFRIGYANLSCPACKKAIAVNLLNPNARIYGFVCPYCDSITCADDMFDLILRKKGVENAPKKN